MLLAAVEKLVVEAVILVGSLVLFQLHSLRGVGLVVVRVVGLHVDGIHFGFV